MLKPKNKDKDIDENQLFHIRYNCLYHRVFYLNPISSSSISINLSIS